MKRIFPFIVLLLSLSWLAPSCSKNTASQTTLLADAELAYSQGHYDHAQIIADSIAAAGNLQRLNVDMLCRLSLLYMHLGERSDEEANIANAAKTLDAAALRDNDSTLAFIRALPVEDQARFMLVEAVSEGSKHVLSPDSLFSQPDSLFR